MQYQVDPTDQSPENGQKPLFWLFGSFKNEILWFLNDPAYAISWPNRQDHLVLSKYAIPSWPDGPNLRKWPTPLLVVPLQPTRRTKKILKSQREFSRTCGFRGVVPERLFYHNIMLSENSLLRFSVKIRPKLKNLKKGHFWARFHE